jgi:cell wall-associated NlpC family hydrolase
MSGWLSAYVGRPWREGASGPEAYDCRGLVLAVQRSVWGREVPALIQPGTAITSDALRSVRHWAPADDSPQPGDVLLLHSRGGPHVGIFVLAGRALRVLHAHGSVVAGRQVGRVRLNDLAELLGAGYGRPQVWRHQP